MKKIINKFTNSIIFVSIISIIIGLLFIIYPDISIKTIGIIIAIYMIIHGIILCIFNFQTRDIFYPIDSLFGGIISIILGIVIIYLLTLIPYIGVIITISNLIYSFGIISNMYLEYRK